MKPRPGEDNMPKFKITAPRYIRGEYVYASPRSPAIVELDEIPAKDRVNEWRNLHLIDEAIADPKPAHAKVNKPHPQSSAVVHGKRAADMEPA